MLLLTADQQCEVLSRLDKAADAHTSVQIHKAGIEYTSLMISFLLHIKTAITVLLKLKESFGEEWFPITIGYQIVRPIFEIDVNAHYITKDPRNRALKYIRFGTVLNWNEMDTCRKYLTSNNKEWQESMRLVWENKWKKRESEIEKKYEGLKNDYQKPNKKGRISRWSGKSLQQMAIEVDHKEAYDVFYSELSSFTHADVRLADRFLKSKQQERFWSARANEYDYGNVFMHANTYFTCFLELFSKEFSCLSNEEIQKCWEI
jgi:hypothetical protein